MSKFIINWWKKLIWEVQISWSKNAALPIICASILFNGTVILKNIPNIADIKTLIKILEFLGAKIKFENNILEINSENLENKFIPIELVHSLRWAILLLWPLLARFWKAEMAQPWWCLIWRRPANAHLNAFSEMWVKILESEKNLRLEVWEKKRKIQIFNVGNFCHLNREYFKFCKLSKFFRNLTLCFWTACSGFMPFLGKNLSKNWMNLKP